MPRYYAYKNNISFDLTCFSACHFAYQKCPQRSQYIHCPHFPYLSFTPQLVLIRIPSEYLSQEDPIEAAQGQCLANVESLF